MEEKVVLITGASSGIGAAIAEHFSEIGYRRISIVARREEKLREVAERCEAKGAEDVLVLPLDLSDMESARSAVVKTVEHFESKYRTMASFFPVRLQGKASGLTTTMVVGLGGCIYTVFHPLVVEVLCFVF